MPSLNILKTHTTTSHLHLSAKKSKKDDHTDLQSPHPRRCTKKDHVVPEQAIT